MPRKRLVPALALEVDIARVGAVLAACVAAVLAVGTLALAGAPLDLFDPAARGANPVHPQHPGDRWLTVPNLVSGGLFLAAGALAVLLRREEFNRRPAAALAVLCSLLGVEQLAAVHERVAAGEPASRLWIAVFRRGP